MTYSMFIAHFAANRRHIPVGVAAQIRFDAIRRIQERQQAGRADCVLDFSDLVDRIEAAIC